MIYDFIRTMGFEDIMSKIFAAPRKDSSRKHSDSSMPREVILDLDSTLLTAYGRQEGRRFNFHYHDSGYHPLLCYDGHTHDLIQLQLRTGNVYSSDGTVDYLQPVLDEYRTEYKDIRLKPGGDSGYAIPATGTNTAIHSFEGGTLPFSEC